MRKTTIRDIALKLNIAPSTVSRALGNDPGVGEKRRLEIRKTAEEMFYKPKPLRRKRTNTIGLILATDFKGTTNKEFLQAVTFFAEREAASRNVHVSLAFTDDSESHEKVSLPPIVDSGRIDGVIVVGCPHESLYRKLIKSKIPAVALHDRAARSGINSVFLNSEPALREAIKRVVKAGRTRIALALNDPLHPLSENLHRAYRVSLDENGIEYDSSLVIDGLTDSFSGGDEAVKHFLALDEKPDLIVFSNDWMAIGGMYYLAQKGLKVPDDISILGHDNIMISMEITPNLTTIDSYLNPTIPEAFDLLEKQINGELNGITEVVINGPLRWRDSCIG